ncbi:hypothetical protein, partial [Escherichia coli]|uniref:hypothetical protein n=1 Tax=Escherichia coli TaxID=562 RepID=UPI001BFEABBA
QAANRDLKLLFYSYFLYSKKLPARIFVRISARVNNVSPKIPNKGIFGILANFCFYPYFSIG